MVVIFAADGLWQDFPENWYRFSWASNLGPDTWIYFKQNFQYNNDVLEPMTVVLVCLLYVSYPEIELYLNHSQIDRIVFINAVMVLPHLSFNLIFHTQRGATGLWFWTRRGGPFHSNRIFHQLRKEYLSS